MTTQVRPRTVETKAKAKHGYYLVPIVPNKPIQNGLSCQMALINSTKELKTSITRTVVRQQAQNTIN